MLAHVAWHVLLLFRFVFELLLLLVVFAVPSVLLVLLLLVCVLACAFVGLIECVFVCCC